jgi:tight adherence protein C
MEVILSQFFGILDNNVGTVIGALVFTASTMLAFGALTAVQMRVAVRRRTADISINGSYRAGDSARLPQDGGLKAVQRVVDYATKHYAGANDKHMRVLRQQMLQAGILDSRAPIFYFIWRTALAIGLATTAFIAVPTFLPDAKTWLWPLVCIFGIIGYLAPGIYLKRRISSRQTEHRSGFPDFMDLLVVCANAGLSMESALDRVGRELTRAYPSLGRNIYMTILEIRAGRPLTEALEHFADRVGLEEARSFATLLQQSEELGSSLTDALRVYSDDMRHKRLSLAEEKAHSLPAKLSIPLIVFIFPVLIVVIMLPAYIRYKYGIS